MFKKAIKTSVPVLMAATALAACGSNDSNSSSDTKGSSDKGYTPEKLTVQFVPSQNAETLEAKAKPLEKLLKKELGIPVEVSVSTNYNTIVEAMKSKKVDIGFLPPTAYVLAHDQKAADVLLQAQRYGVNNDGTPTKELVDYYKSQFIVKKDSGIDSLKDMKGKRIAMQDVTSTAGYVFPAVDLKNEGIDPLKDMEVTTVKGHDQAVISLLNDDVDVAVTFQDARNIVKGDQPNVFKDTKIVKYTEKIPNDTISARSDMTDKWKKKISDAFIKIGKDKEGQKVIREVYSHEGYVKSDDSKFDIIRDYDKKVKE